MPPRPVSVVTITCASELATPKQRRGSLATNDPRPLYEPLPRSGSFGPPPTPEQVLEAVEARDVGEMSIEETMQANPLLQHLHSLVEEYSELQAADDNPGSRHPDVQRQLRAERNFVRRRIMEIGQNNPVLVSTYNRIRQRMEDTSNRRSSYLHVF
eukprot:4219693-Pleurochrysis_carterae.AAC.1